MLKIAGLIGIILICTLAGFLWSSGLRARQKRLQAICIFIEELSDCIRRGVSLIAAVSQKGKAAGISFEGLKILISREGLKTEDITLLEEFFAPLGLGDTESQIKRCEIYLEMLRKRETAAANLVKEKSGLYGRLGFFAGLFLAIMIW